MFSPFRVTAKDSEGKVLDQRDVSDSHELQDVEADFAQRFPGCIVAHEAQ